jgi:2-polyprenyl-3-methyl-5-hydroxy-6-metoxy-1,4-benzoquinol methylase
MREPTSEASPASRPAPRTGSAPSAVEELQRLFGERAEDAPRVALLLFGCDDPAALRATLDRIPKPVDEWLAEALVVLDRPEGPGAPALAAEECGAGRRFPVRVHRPPRASGPGGARKAAFEYAVRQRFDRVVVLRGDGAHPPEALPELLRASLVEGRPLVLGSRLVRRAESVRAGMSPLRVAAHGLATFVQNRVLGLRVHDWHTAYRAYATDALASVPYQLDADDRTFDVEILIQLRALGVEPHEVTVLPAWREDPRPREELVHVWRACRTALGYRLHQLHVTRDGRYLVERGVHYTLKQSPSGSHMQIVDAIRPGSRVLDLGCSQGLLARPLREKSARLTGVDSAPARRLAAELEAYHRCDLEQPLELPLGRVFDTVVCADVIEHLRNRQELLRSARRFLVPSGRLVISTPNIALWFYRLSLLVGRFEYGPRGVLDRTHVHLYTRATFRREVERAGFRVVRERVTALPFEVVFESTGRSRLVRALASAYHALARLWPELFAYQFILEAEITTLDEEATLPPAAPRAGEGDPRP